MIHPCTAWFEQDPGFFAPLKEIGEQRQRKEIGDAPSSGIEAKAVALH